ncbi:serine/threonine-protein kinase [Streptomyces flavofungini]|uniref:non-specific serine/threonine protein kinase n=1 Tax=Streptomyces flavofungini TaxID=68200 RepID=A0ABS0X5P2_9ACTN|nr:serine/threonine-protein kinase [Streptomyces flavofungini]MBJ3808502.1 protein kinase [Streptomyces flavofungini]GHC69961.1 serine/threonine protein kinase [Streptomyces flavofungini]
MQGLLLAGRYRLGESIGSGGMGRVWRARDEVLHRVVAVKELTAAQWVQEADREVLLTRTKTEARAQAQINHSAVVTVHDVLEYDDRPWIVMELVEGHSLADAVRDQGRIEPREAARVGLWVLRALRAAHGAGVLHRDIKPGNVLLSEDGRVLLTDFGIASIEGDSTITRTGEVVGSVDYLAPERVSGANPGPAADLWALGATLYTAVEGNSPFRRTSPLGTMQAVVTEEPDPARYAGPLGPVISALLAKDPDARPDAAEAEQMLAEAAEGRRPGAAQAYVPTTTYEGPTAHTPTPHPSHPSTPHPSGSQTPPPHAPGPHTPPSTPVPGHPGQAAYSGHVGTGGRTSGQAADPSGYATPPPYGTTPTHVASAPHGASSSYGDSGRNYPGALTAATPAGPGRRRWLRALVPVVVAAAIGGGAVFGYLNFKGDGDDGDRRAGAGSGQGKGGKAGDVVGGIPKDWVRVHDVKGFSLMLPKGWERQVDGSQIDYTPDGGRHFVRIGVDPSPDFDSPYAHQLDLEKQVKPKLPEYRRLHLNSNTFRDRPAALWEFSWTAGANDTTKGPRHAIEQTYISRGGTEYVIYMSGPEGSWDKTREQFDAVLQSWRD